MNTPTKTTGQVKRLVLEIDGTKIVLDQSVTKEEALNLLDILAKGAKRLDSHYASTGVSYQEVAYAEKDVDVALRVTGAVIMDTRSDAQASAEAAAVAAETEVAK